MMIALYLFLAVTASLLVWFLVSLIWGKPWSIHLFYTREFLKLAWDEPELLTQIGLLEKFGLHGHNARLADASDAHDVRSFARLHASLNMLRSYDRKLQNPATLLSTDLLDWFLDNLLRVEIFRHHNYPLNQMSGVQAETPNLLLTLHPLTSREEARNYLKRLSRFGVKFDQVLEGLKLRERLGIIPPKFVIRRVLDEMIAFTDQPVRANPLYTVFRDKIGGLKLKTSEQNKLLAEAEGEIERTVYPAYQRLIAYFLDLEARATSDDGVWKFPDGEAYYAYCLRSHTTTELTPEEVHAIGVKEVERIEAEMRSTLEKLGYPGVPNPPQKLREFSRELRFLYPDNDEGRTAALADYQKILDHADQNLGGLFDLRPKAGLKVERVPEFREKTAPAAYYQSPDIAGARPGVFFANLRSMREVPKFGMKTLSYHEGIPGHHFQIAIAQELRSLPTFRRLIPFTAFDEGWALYAEKLTRENGFYRNDPYDELGCLDSELFRAVRLVVDTGIHAKRWTRQQAIDYMQAHTGEALESVVSEIERYIVMPGLRIQDRRNQDPRAAREGPPGTGPAFRSSPVP